MAFADCRSLNGGIYGISRFMPVLMVKKIAELFLGIWVMLNSHLMVFPWAAKLDDGKSTIDLALLILKNIKKGKICLFVKA
jgi:hypothetical protein